MSIQGNFNNGIFQAATLASMAKINETLSKLGISSIDELRSKIKDLEIEIAKAEDYGVDPIKMKQLLNQYLEIEKAYVAAEKEEADKKAQTNAVGAVIGVVLSIVFIIIMICVVTTI